jgi:hypothetical protein
MRRCAATAACACPAAAARPAARRRSACASPRAATRALRRHTRAVASGTHAAAVQFWPRHRHIRAFPAPREATAPRAARRAHTLTCAIMPLPHRPSIPSRPRPTARARTARRARPYARTRRGASPTLRCPTDRAARVARALGLTTTRAPVGARDHASLSCARGRRPYRAATPRGACWRVAWEPYTRAHTCMRPCRGRRCEPSLATCTATRACSGRAWRGRSTRQRGARVCPRHVGVNCAATQPRRIRRAAARDWWRRSLASATPQPHASASGWRADTARVVVGATMWSTVTQRQKRGAPRRDPQAASAAKRTLARHAAAHPATTPRSSAR